MVVKQIVVRPVSAIFSAQSLGVRRLRLRRDRLPRRGRPRRERKVRAIDCHENQESDARNYSVGHKGAWLEFRYECRLPEQAAYTQPGGECTSIGPVKNAVSFRMQAPGGPSGIQTVFARLHECRAPDLGRNTVWGLGAGQK